MSTLLLACLVLVCYIAVLVGAGRGTLSTQVSSGFSGLTGQHASIAGEIQSESYCLIDLEGFSQNAGLNSNCGKNERTIVMFGL